jgi:transcriptional regulator with XRE-family HTH domain
VAEKAYITPEVLKWARESARIPVEIACKKVNVPAEKLESWENGTAQPTMNQAELLAKAYRRPFAVLFLPKIPRDFTLLHDFRAKTSAPLGTGAIFIMREIQQKQQWLRELREDNKEEPLPFVGRYSPSSNPQEVAKDILNTLGINPAAYSSTNQLREWINKSEAAGICVSRTSFIHSNLKLDNEEFQGFVIADNLAPFVFINSDDWEAPQLFTLVHELAHVWIAESGVTDIPRPGTELKDRFDPVELFCNEVAANALEAV